jgi:hypothetical protein
MSLKLRAVPGMTKTSVDVCGYFFMYWAHCGLGAVLGTFRAWPNLILIAGP